MVPRAITGFRPLDLKMELVPKEIYLPVRRGSQVFTWLYPIMVCQIELALFLLLDLLLYIIAVLDARRVLDFES